MKRLSLLVTLVISVVLAFSQTIAIQEVLYNQSFGNDKFELINTSSGTVDISSWWVCARFGYIQLSSPSSIEVLEGNLVMPPGSIIKMRLINLDLHNTHSDFGIFLDGNFGSASSMVDFIQWGNSSDVGRGYVAVEKGIWSDLNPPNNQLDFIPTATNGESANWNGQNSGGGELTLSSDFENAAPTLPIRLLTLTGRINMDKKVELNWTAIDEFNSDKHFIESSTDDNSFSVIGDVSAQNLGAIPAHYYFMDELPVINSINRYRIRQVDYDGKENLSSILYLKVKDVERHEMFISPMPISGNGCFSMELYWPLDEALAQFQIVDMNGKEIDNFKQPLKEGYNNIMHQFYGLEPGQYLIAISNKEGYYCSQTFIIGK